MCFRGRPTKPVFIQIARQVVKLNAADLRLPARAWKVKLVGEGADDAGGVFDDLITEMVQVYIQVYYNKESWYHRGAIGTVLLSIILDWLVLVL
jgi:hypothetical protein